MPAAVQQLTEEGVQSIRDDILKSEQSKGKEVLEALSDGTIHRFWRATGGKHQLTVKRLIHTTLWRLAQQPEQQVCQVCAKSRTHRSHWQHLIGYDRQCRPVFFTSFMALQDAGATGSIQHMLVEFETAIKAMDPDVEAWTWILDFRGFGRRLQDYNPTIAIKFAELSSSHYPERLGALWVVDAPRVVGPLWNLVRPLMDPKTHSKVRFIRFDTDKAHDDHLMDHHHQQHHHEHAAEHTTEHTSVPLEVSKEAPPASHDSQGHEHQDRPPAQASSDGRRHEHDNPVRQAGASHTPYNTESKGPGSSTAAEVGPDHEAAVAAAEARGVAMDETDAHADSKHHHEDILHAHPKFMEELLKLVDEEMADYIISEITTIRAWDLQQKNPPKQQPQQQTQRRGFFGFGRGWSANTDSTPAESPSTAAGASVPGAGSEIVLQAPAYDIALLKEAVSKGDLSLLPVQPNGHCHYGCASFLQKLVANPKLLLGAQQGSP